MKRCWIVGAGDVAPQDFPLAVGQEDLLIAADGGYETLRKAGQVPHLLVGDFDSFQRPQTTCQTIDLPIEKDETDLVAAVQEGFRRGYTHFMLYGGLGGKRFSHSVANLQLLAYIEAQGGWGELIEGNTRVVLLHNQSKTFTCPTGTACSVLSYDASAVISLQGLYYPLQQATITNTFPLGVSNHFTQESATVTVHSGRVIVILES